jgi:hypothetical protein
MILAETQKLTVVVKKQMSLETSMIYTIHRIKKFQKKPR